MSLRRRLPEPELPAPTPESEPRVVSAPSLTEGVLAEVADALAASLAAAAPPVTSVEWLVNIAELLNRAAAQAEPIREAALTGDTARVTAGVAAYREALITAAARTLHAALDTDE